jgi:hypothetical protein
MEMREAAGRGERCEAWPREAMKERFEAKQNLHASRQASGPRRVRHIQLQPWPP